MTKSFSPRELDPSAWKTWHKDAARLMGRLGWTWTLLWCAGVPSLCYALFAATKDTLGYLGCLYGMQVLGVLCQPLLLNVMDRAAAGKGAPLIEVLSETFTEVRNHPTWFRGRILGQLVGLGFMLSFMVTLFLISANSAPSDAPAPIPNPYSGMSNLVMFFVFVPIMLRDGGLLSFHYWFRVRNGFDAQVSSKLQSVTLVLNNRAMFLGMISLVVAFFAISTISLLALFLLPAMHWYHAAFTRCAYHDIFEGGTGIEEKVAQASATFKPVLQA